jgi:hypothetical protein
MQSLPEFSGTGHIEYADQWLMDEYGLDDIYTSGWVSQRYRA